MHRSATAALVLLSCSVACTGVVESGPAGPRGTSRGPTTPGAIDVRFVTTAIPPLSRREVDATLLDVLGVEGAAARHLPPDPATLTSPATGAEEEVFDTEILTKTPSQVLVEGLESLATEVARDFTADHARVDALAGCAPASSAEEPACLGALARTLALRLWGRPMTEGEESALVALATPFVSEAGYYVGARLIVSSIVQSPELLYRTEIGTDAGDGLRRLTAYELLARTSYFLWGSAPTPELLARIEASGEASGGELGDTALAALAEEMAADPRADAQMRLFHRMWLRYDRMLVTDPALAADMRAESDALVDRALAGDGASWRDLFTSTDTFVTPALASHYGLATVPSAPEWVAYDDAQRAGLLTHGSFLSLSSTRGVETLPSRRGAMIARRILCIPILPPPADVDIDDGVEVAPGACKAEAYEAHASGTCRGCHDVLDGIGFGFERFDGLGRYRTVESESPSCAIDGVGRLGTGTFASPRELTTMVDGSGELARCGVAHVVRFAQRHVAASGDSRLVDRLSASFEASGHDFRALMVAVVRDPAFRLRREEEAP